MKKDMYNPECMDCFFYYRSPLGKIMLASDLIGLKGLWFEGQKGFGRTLQKDRTETESQYIKLAEEWLDIYFRGEIPDIDIPLHLEGTPFQLTVWKHLKEIPYGKTASYYDISSKTAEELGKPHMSGQAIGNAVSRNPISIIIPCHRVIGKDGSLRGYAGGIERKRSLLLLERDQTAL